MGLTRKRQAHLQLERLEDRCTPSAAVSGNAGYLLVPEFDHNNVLRFDATTGAFVDEFVKRDSGGVSEPYVAIYGPHDHNLYVDINHFRGPGQIKAVLR